MSGKHLIFNILGLLLVVSCAFPGQGTTGYSDPDLGWLLEGPGPYELCTSVSAMPGQAGFELVKDLSLMDPEPEVVLSTSVTVAPDGSITVPLGMLEPGFYQARLRDTLRWNIGICPEQIVSAPDAMPDFEEFWKGTFAELSEVPMEPSLTEVLEWSNDVRTCYELRFNSLDGAVAGGIVSIPNAAGKYPVAIQYMGYGAEPFCFDPSANPERIDFLVSVRDQGIFKEGQNLWIDRGLSSREDFYYRGAFCDARRALDWVLSLDKADPSRVVAMGESQGGALTVAAAAWEPRLGAVTLAVPFLGDYPDYGKIVWWPMHEVYQTADEDGLDRGTLMEMLSYFDMKNWAPHVTCPVYMAFGLQDPTCPPHTNFAIYNNLGSKEKHYLCVQTCDHQMWKQECWTVVRDNFLAPYLQ